MNALLDEFHAELSAGLFTGAQLFVAVGSDIVLDAAIGDALPGTPINTRTVFNLHCALKPIVALALAEVLERHGLDESARVSEILGCGTSELTVRDVCAHSAGLTDPNAFSFHLMSEGEREDVLAPEVLLESSTRGSLAYSEVAGWQLLRLMIETLDGRSADAKIASDLEAMGISEIWFRAGSPTDPRVATIGCYVDCASGLPLLHDRLERFCAPRGPNPEGGFASCSALGHWYIEVLRAFEGATIQGLPSPALIRRWVRDRVPRSPDVSLRRDCSFSLGFMSDLATHGFGSAPSPDAFGQSGFLGNSFGIVDPVHRVIVCMFKNGLGGDAEFNVTRLRPIAISRIYSTLGLPGLKDS